MIWLVLYFGTEVAAAVGPVDMTMRECAQRAFEMPGASQAYSIGDGSMRVQRGEVRCVYSDFRPGPWKGV